MTKFALARFFLIILMAVAIPAAATRAGGHDQQAAREALKEGKILPLTKILKIAEKREPGVVIDVELEFKHKRRLIYEIKVLTPQGRVRELKVDARTGEIIKIKDD